MEDLSLVSSEDLIQELIERSEFIVACFQLKSEKKETFQHIFNGDYIEKAGAVHCLNNQLNDLDLDLRDDREDKDS
jgi:hypothetical protein